MKSINVHDPFGVLQFSITSTKVWETKKLTFEIVQGTIQKIVYCPILEDKREIEI